MSDNGGDCQGEDERFVVRCRGLPWSCTKDELVEFFAPVEIDPENIHMTTNREGRPSGEAYVQVNTKEDQEEAIKKHRKNMGKRYVEVFESKWSEMEWVVKRNSGNGGPMPGFGGMGGGPTGTDGGENVVRLRGLPFEASKGDIIKFFEGLDITNNGILLTTNYQGRATGEAFVQFANRDHVEEALKKNKESIGHRYIEVFLSSMAEAFRNQGPGGPPGGPGPMGGPSGRGYGMMGPRGGMGGRPGPYDRMGGPMGGGMGRGFGPNGPGSRGSRSFKSFGGGGNYGGDFGGRGGGWGGPGGPGGPNYVVRMRGLPFRVTENDIGEWFSSVADPVGIQIMYNNDGRPTGEAEVAFASAQDAKRSLSKDRQNMQHRYVELFYDGPDPDNDNSGGNGGYGGGNGGYGGPGGMMAGGGGGGGGGFGGGFGGGNNGDGFGGY